MKVAVVPAQVTTVEDRIAGNLSMSQMMLLAIPVFGGSALFAALPPFMGGSPYKYVLLGMLALIACGLAIRIRGKIILFWMLLIVRYSLRPTYYLYDKHTLVSREVLEPIKQHSKEHVVRTKKPHNTKLPNMSITDATHLMGIIENPAAKLRFAINKKGALYVRITEIEK
jgi:hypothetical protein